MRSRHSLTPATSLHLAVTAALLGSGAVGSRAIAQQVRVMAPVGAVGVAQGQPENVGVPVEMFENPNLDRYLRVAQTFLDREDYMQAIRLLQDVIEGRTTVAVDTAPEAGPAPAAGTPAAGTDAPKDNQPVRSTGAGQEKPAPGKGANQPGPTAAQLDASQSVFSQDGRLYRPVRRLCHELLARLPSVGIELYRTAYEVPAAQLLESAMREGSVSALEQVASRYFITLPAGRAMLTLADRLMHEGRYRSAVQVLRDLVEIYPPANRNRLGISEVWCRFKIALCLRLAGEDAAAHAAALELAQNHPDESLRILGELQAVKDLPQSEAFAIEVLAAMAAPTAKGPQWLSGSTEALVPLWQYRFKNPEPYREPKATQNQDGSSIMIMGDGVQTTAMPHAGRYGPGTWVAFSWPGSPAPGTAGASVSLTPPRALFLEHFRLRVADALSGVLLAQGDGVEEPPTARENHPRVRIAAVDYALLRPVEDEARRYVVIGHDRATSASAEPLKTSQLVAYRRDSLERAWTSQQWLDGELGLREVTFLAAPTVFGERLLLPSLRRNAYTLQCLDRSTGRPLWHTPLHAGGTAFFKAPGSPVVVHGGTAYVTTNAGCLAAVDAFAGDLRWIRNYERVDPLRHVPRPKASTPRGGRAYGMQFLQTELTGFLPNELVASKGLVVVAPCDGDMLLCLDGASGQPVWMLDAVTRYAPYGKLKALVGASGDNLFAVSETHLVCIGLRGGLLRWSRDLPTWNGPKTAGRGRGVVVADYVVLPGESELLVFDAAGRAPMRRIPIPTFGAGREPLAGSFHLSANGPWLALGYAGGVEVFSSAEALQQLAAQATDPMQKVGFLVQVGDLEAAAAVLVQHLADPALAAERRPQVVARLLTLVRERALSLAKAGKRAEAMAALDALETVATDRDVRLEWHLARLEVCKEIGDLLAHEREQQRLYDYMEGKG